MGTTAISHTMQELLQRQEAFFRRIPGISALRHAAPESIPELEAKYPDAAFALMISDNLFVGDRELNEIHQKAYTAILRGESISGVRFRYDYDTESHSKLLRQGANFVAQGIKQINTYRGLSSSVGSLIGAVTSSAYNSFKFSILRW